jgi:hypothetical protein
MGERFLMRFKLFESWEHFLSFLTPIRAKLKIAVQKAPYAQSGLSPV